MTSKGPEVEDFEEACIAMRHQDEEIAKLRAKLRDRERRIRLATQHLRASAALVRAVGGKDTPAEAKALAALTTRRPLPKTKRSKR